MIACKSEPAPGDTCKPSDIRCLDPKTELICQNGVFVAAPCKGPRGCHETRDRLFCDFSANATGDICSLSEQGNAQCTADEKGWVVCLGGRYEAHSCRGSKGCHKHEGTLRCDQSVAVEGDACTGASSACSVDRKSVLACKEGRFAATAACPGKDGCTVTDGSLTCDMKKDDSKEIGQVRR